MLERVCLGLLMLCCSAEVVLAQSTERSISLKSGETTDVGTAYFVVNCRSILKGDPTVDLMEGPPGVTVMLRKEKIVPRSSNCSRPVPGGTLVVTAPKDIKARAEGKLTMRVNYETLDGKRQSTREYNVILFP
jgi:hypothetical protein